MNPLVAKLEALAAAWRHSVFQRLLFGPGQADIAVDPEICFSYEPDRYPANWYCEGRYAWRKHYYPLVGELRNEGEEYDCAVFIDGLDEVRVWVRNLDRRPDSSFWLQTSTDRFYPDFVARLNDGRILVVESKGADRWSNDDSREKRAIGALWEERSAGRCLFIMPNGPDWDAIRAKIHPA